MNEHCHKNTRCVLRPGHVRICRDADGMLIPTGDRYYSSQAEKFRADPAARIGGSLSTEFTSESAEALRAIVNAAIRLEPYLTYYLWNEKLHELRQSPNPASFFRACLANHGLELDL